MDRREVVAPHFFPIDEIFVKNICCAENLFGSVSKISSRNFWHQNSCTDQRNIENILQVDQTSDPPIDPQLNADV